MNREQPVLYLVIPCYNEENVLPLTSGLFAKKIRSLVSLGKISEKSRVLFVNDGSRDKTWEIISDLSKKQDVFEGICLSRNRGHQNALLAGLMEVCGVADAAISIDCDGQDDINAMDEMVEKYRRGIDIVYGVRSARDTDTFFKRFTAESFYRLMNGLGAEIKYNHADYRLMSKRALEGLRGFHEVNLFLRGLVPMVGYPSDVVYYERHERMAGESHYPLRKMMALAVNGITSLSIKPIRIITFAGGGLALLSFWGVFWSVGLAIMGETVVGWASIVSIMCFLGGIQLLGLGVIGEYVGKIYMESKQRPRWIVQEKTNGMK